MIFEKGHFDFTLLDRDIYFFGIVHIFKKYRLLLILPKDKVGRHFKCTEESLTNFRFLIKTKKENLNDNDFRKAFINKFNNNSASKEIELFSIRLLVDDTIEMVFINSKK